MWQREIFTGFLNGEEKVRYYIFLDMTGDGIEKLIIFCNDDPERLCVIQCSYGILKVIHDLNGRCDAFLVKYNGRTGICHDWERYDGESEDFKHFYSMNDTGSFKDCDISKGSIMIS
ncbi:MAG: hypothetical protein HDR07_08635 [Lachnospiraceae bacterium]|nr:hypothetical protein [Lachnospiraceae bacterium]